MECLLSMNDRISPFPNPFCEIELNKAICLLSRHPFFETFEIFLKFLYQMTVSNSIQHLSIEEHVSRFMNLPFPSRVLKVSHSNVWTLIRYESYLVLPVENRKK